MAIALLLLGAAHVLHAAQDLSRIAHSSVCMDVGDASHEHEPGSQEDCCGFHQSMVAVLSLADVRPTDCFSGPVAVLDDSCPDGPVREIDHPPQLS